MSGVVRNGLSLYERLAAVTVDLGEITEDLSEATYEAIESETLKRVAIAAGIDHTIESARIIEALGVALQHERDVNRELRRHNAGLIRVLDQQGQS